MDKNLAVARVLRFFRRFLLCLSGIILLSGPSAVMYLATVESEKISRSARKMDAEEKNHFAANLLRNRESGVVQLENKFQEIAESIASEVSLIRDTAPRDLGSSPANLTRAGLARLAGLRAVGISPEVMMISRYRWIASQTPSDEVAPALCVGVDGERREILTRLLAYLSRYVLSAPDSQEKAKLNLQLPPLFGKNTSTADMATEYRGRFFPISWNNELAYVFWQPLFLPDYPKKILESSLPFDYRRIKVGRFSPTALKTVLLGSILWIVNRDVCRYTTPERIIAGIDPKQDLQLGFFPVSGGSPVVSSGITEREMMALSRKDLESAESLGWVIEKEEIELDQVYSMIIATRISGIDQITMARHARDRLVVALAFLLGSGIWFLAAFRNWGLPSFLSAQLLWGFVLAALLPLASTYLVSELLVEEHFESRLRAERSNLHQEMELAETRGYFHRYWLMDLIKKLSRSPVMQKCLVKRAELGPQSVWNLRLAKVCQKFLRYILSPPIEASIRNFSLVSSQESLFHFPTPKQEQDYDKLSIVIGQFGRQVLKNLNPTLESEKNVEKENMSDMKAGMLWEYGIDYIRTLFGPEAYYNTMFAPNSPTMMTLGAGNWGWMNVLVPASGNPCFSVTWIFLTKYSDRRALGRGLGIQKTPWKIFVLTSDQIGMPMQPVWGESYPFVREIARQVFVSGTSLSSRVAYEGETWLVEGTPLVQSSQFILVGITPLSRVENAVTALRTRLHAGLLGFFALVVALALFASQDILGPIRALTTGMAFIQQGNFRHRVLEERRDELGEVCRRFNSMARGLEEGKIMEKMVSFTARHAAGSESAMEQARQGRKTLVTILYIGIPGFEDVLHTLDPKDLFQRLNEQVGFICRCIVDQGGDVDKLMGDKVLAFFSHSSFAGETLSKALCGTLRSLCAAQDQGNIPFPISAGINTGEVISGLLGAGERLDYTIIGDPVNLAARSQAVADGLPADLLRQGARIVMTEATRQVLGEAVQTTALQVTEVKGKQEAVKLFQLQK